MQRSTLFYASVTLFLLASVLSGCDKDPTSTPVPDVATATPRPVLYGPQEPTEGLAPSPTVAPPTPLPTVRIVQKAVPPKAGAQAFDFSLQDLEGNTVALSDFRGRKVMLNFWATWCGPCRAEIPHMVELYQERRHEGLEIVAVNLRESQKRASAFANQFDMSFTVLLDPKARVGKAYFVRGIPTSVFINEDGVIEAVHVGTLAKEVLTRYVDQLLR